MYGIRNCDTVKKARAFLEGRGVAYAFHDYQVSGIDEARLRQWCGELGWEALPSLIKRPVLDVGERRLVGFSPALYESVR